MAVENLSEAVRSLAWLVDGSTLLCAGPSAPTSVRRLGDEGLTVPAPIEGLAGISALDLAIVPPASRRAGAPDREHQATLLAAVHDRLLFVKLDSFHVERWIDTGGLIGGLALLEGGRAFAYGSAKGIWVLSSETGAALARIRVHGDLLSSLATGLRGDVLFTGDRQGRVRVWAGVSGEELAAAELDSEVLMMSGCDGPRIAVALGRGVEVWGFEEGVAKRLFAEPIAAQLVRLSADGRLLLTAGPDEHLRCWSVDTGELLALSYGHHAPVLAATIDRAGRWLASASADATVRIWELIR